MRTMFTFKSFLVIIIFCQFVTSSKFIVLTIIGEQSSYLLKSTENQNEFIGPEAIKLNIQNHYWTFDEKYFYKTSDSGSLPLGGNEWTFGGFLKESKSMIEIKELQCGKNPGYLIKENNAVNFRKDKTEENCFRQVL